MVSFSTLCSVLAAVAALGSSTIQAQTCTDVHVVFARGTNQPAGLGAVGIPLVSGITSGLPGKTVSSYAVEYEANQSQTSAGPGATVMTKHIVAYAASCPKAVFVIGGYSQGATVTDIAIGIRTILGSGQVIPTTLAPRIKAVVTFGNPIAIFGQSIAKNSALYGAKSIDYCAKGDPICGNGSDFNAHLSYPKDGSVTTAATRAVKMVVGTTRNLRIYE